MTQQRNVSKNQILSEDIALGVGQVTQTRRGVQVTGSRVDIPVPVYSVAEIAAFNPNVANRLMLQVSADKYIYYIYSDSFAEGIKSDIFVGYWVPQNLKSDLVLSSDNAAAVSVSGDNENNLITVDNASGCIITVGSAAKTQGVTSIPCMVFIRSDTDGDVLFVGDTGITVSSASTNMLFGKNSGACLIALSETHWWLVGDLQVV